MRLSPEARRRDPFLLHTLSSGLDRSWHHQAALLRLAIPQDAFPRLSGGIAAIRHVPRVRDSPHIQTRRERESMFL